MELRPAGTGRRLVFTEQGAFLDGDGTVASRRGPGSRTSGAQSCADDRGPLDLIDVSSPDAIDDARMIADMMVAVDEGAENVHWNESAHAFPAGLALFVKVPCRTRGPAGPSRSGAGDTSARHAEVTGRV